jgi:hypothetical protein
VRAVVFFYSIGDGDSVGRAPDDKKSRLSWISGKNILANQQSLSRAHLAQNLLGISGSVF